jgi:hypothetical protein
MTGIPDELVLMGDNFESDPIIYLTLAKILRDNVDPWVIWNSIKEQDIFQLKKNQNSQFLNKIYQLDNLISRKNKKFNQKTKIKIYIRKRFKNDELSLSDNYKRQKKLIDLIEMYDGLYKEDYENRVKGAENTI